MGIGEAMDMHDELEARKKAQPCIYVATSWKNVYHATATTALKQQDFKIYDFKNPTPGNHGFHWRDLEPRFNPDSCTLDEFNQVIEHPIVRHAAALDLAGLMTCDACLMILPCGSSAHLELGYMTGQRKPGVIWAPEPFKVDLMYTLANYMNDHLEKCIQQLKRLLGR